MAARGKYTGGSSALEGVLSPYPGATALRYAADNERLIVQRNSGLEDKPRVHSALIRH